MGSNSLSRLYPRPREVTLAGRIYRVGEVRVGDLATLQHWLDGRWQDPLDAIRDSLGSMEESELRAALRGIWDECEEGPPTWGDERSDALFATGSGILQIFRSALARYQPELDEEAVTAIAERTSRAEYAALQRAWFGVEPGDEVARMLEVDPGDRGSPIGWPQAICEVCEAYGWTIEYVETLTISQLCAARRCGKPVERGTAVQPHTDLQERVRRARLKVHGTEEKGAG